MANCFATGCEYVKGKATEEVKPALSVDRVIEFMEYDLEAGKATLWVDLFVKNNTDQETSLRLIYPSNLSEMQNVSPEFFKDTFQTRLFREYIGRQLMERGSIRTDTRSIQFSGFGEQIQDYFIQESQIKRIDLPMHGDGEVPFSLYEIGPILPYSMQVSRFKGDAEFVFNRDRPLLIYGGKKLLRELGYRFSDVDFNLGHDELEKYESALKEFGETQHVFPKRYDILIWEASGRQKIETFIKSVDLNLEYGNKIIEGKYVSWYLSNAYLFSPSSENNGLELEVVTFKGVSRISHLVDSILWEHFWRNNIFGRFVE